MTITTGALARGTHRLTFQVSDYQETRNMENVGPILPNTRTISTTFRVQLTILLALFDRRELLEVALDARGEFLALRARRCL